jgi:hypothetical protein
MTLYEEALSAASKELSLPQDNWNVEKLASLRLMLKVAQHKWSGNQTSGVAREMIDLMGAITELLDKVKPTEEVQVRVNFAKTAVGIGFATCPECGHRAQHRFAPDELAPLPPKPAPVEVPIVEAAPSTATPAPTPASAPPRVVVDNKPLIDYSPMRRPDGGSYNPFGSEVHR